MDNSYIQTVAGDIDPSHCRGTDRRSQNFGVCKTNEMPIRAYGVVGVAHLEVCMALSRGKENVSSGMQTGSLEEKAPAVEGRAVELFKCKFGEDL